jgi:hypothetical protein
VGSIPNTTVATNGVSARMIRTPSVATHTRTTATPFEATSASIDDCRYPPTVTPITACDSTVAGRGRSRCQRARIAKAIPPANPAKSGGVGAPTRSRRTVSATTPPAIADHLSAARLTWCDATRSGPLREMDFVERACNVVQAQGCRGRVTLDARRFAHTCR